MPRRVDYDRVAASYDRRYDTKRYGGIEAALRDWAEGARRVLEVGCGTGHWLARLLDWGCTACGVDPSGEMLRQAARRGLDFGLVRARAEALPVAPEAFDRVAVINAAHHFTDVPRFVREARRVLVPGGGLIVMGLDPSLAADRWFVYDYFEGTLERDLARYPSTDELTEALRTEGFVDCSTTVAERIEFSEGAREALDQGMIARDATSQLLLLTDEEYDAGLDRIRADAVERERRGLTLRLTGSLPICATAAIVPG